MLTIKTPDSQWRRSDVYGYLWPFSGSKVKIAFHLSEIRGKMSAASLPKLGSLETVKPHPLKVVTELKVK